MRLVFLFTSPSFSKMVALWYHHVPPCRHASSPGSPHHQAAPSGSFLISYICSSVRAATRLPARTRRARAAPVAAAAATSATSLENRRGSWGFMSHGRRRNAPKNKKNHAITRTITRAITC